MRGGGQPPRHRCVTLAGRCGPTGRFSHPRYTAQRLRAYASSSSSCNHQELQSNRSAFPTAQGLGSLSLLGTVSPAASCGPAGTSPPPPPASFLCLFMHHHRASLPSPLPDRFCEFIQVSGGGAQISRIQKANLFFFGPARVVKIVDVISLRCVRLSVRPSIRPSVYPSVRLSACLPQ